LFFIPRQHFINELLLAGASNEWGTKRFNPRQRPHQNASSHAEDMKVSAAAVEFVDSRYSLPILIDVPSVIQAVVGQ